jgi:hypothetical protein
LSDVIVRAYDATGEKIGEDITDQTGSYMIDYLGKNSYYLEFALPNGYGITQAHVGTDETMDSDVDGSNGPMTTKYYTINPGEHIPNIDAGVVLGVLSVEWLDVAVRDRNTYNNITWDVALQTNVSHYEVERSIDGIADFVSIGKVLATSDTESKVSYDYQDYDVADAGIYYYRLKQIDLDQAYDYSTIVSVERTGSTTDREMRAVIYPNPVVDELTLDMTITKQVKDLVVSIYDAQGRTARANAIVDIDIEAGANSYKLDVSDFARGVYSMKIKLDRKEIVKKLIIVE